MIWTVVAFLVQVHLHRVSAEVKTSSFAREPSAVEGVLYTNNLLFEAHRQSKIRCAEMCATKDGCVTVTFTPPTSLQPSTCRGYSAIVTPSDPSQPSPGTQVYRIAGTRCLGPLRSFPSSLLVNAIIVCRRHRLVATFSIFLCLSSPSASSKP